MHGETGIIVEDIVCARCGYTLKGLANRGRCPECGGPIRSSTLLSLQWKVDVRIDAPVERVWDAIEDLSLIPRYHPVVGSVECEPGRTRRAPGVAYKCIVPEGRHKGWCVERVVEHVPLRRTTVAFSEDSWGMRRMLGEFLAVTTVEAQADGATVVRLEAYYDPPGLRMRLMNTLFVRRIMRKRAMLTIDGFKRLIEEGGRRARQ